MFRYRTKDSSEQGASFITDDYTKSHIDQLKTLVISDKIYDWKVLSCSLGFSIESVRKLWQLIIYPTIKINEKIGGSVKWSQQQDDILRGFIKSKSDEWQEIAVFLPSRSPCSIEARWKRIMHKTIQFVVTVEAPIEIEQVVETSSSMIPQDFGPYDYRKNTISQIWGEYKTKAKKQSVSWTSSD